VLTLLKILSRLLAVMAITGLTACAGASSQQAIQDVARTIVYGLTLQPSGFDPHINASSELGIPLRSVYDTLVFRNPTDNAFVPGLATSWRISDDGLTYTFTLRQGVTFHDGTGFSAQAVAANLDRITNPETASQRAVFLLGPYSGHQVIDDFTISIILSETFAPLLDGLSQVYLGMASPTALATYSNEIYQFHQVGTGPYRFVDYLPGDHLTLEINPQYTWAPSFVTPAAAPAERIIFRFFEDPPTRALSIENGSAQVVGELVPADARNLAANSAISVLPEAIPGQPLQFLINTNQFPTNDERVRQALLFATNRDAIIDGIFQRFSPVAWGPLSAATAFYSPSIIGRYAYDPSQATRLLAEAGFTDNDASGYVDFGGADLQIRLLVPPWGLIPQVAQYLQEQWREVGLQVVLDQVPSRAALFEGFARGEFNLGAYYEFGIDPAFLARYFGTGGANNWTGFSDPSLDAMFSQALTATDDQTRQSLYAQAQSLIMDRALLLPIRDYVNLNGARGVTGLTFDAYGWFPLLNALSVNQPAA
jgi:peptide/nickel transport system substrate-binding protein